MTTLQVLLREGAARLRAACVDDPAGDARRLLCHATGISRDRLLLHLGDVADAQAVTGFAALLEARARRVPVSHLLGGRAFYGRMFQVTPDVLDPRPDTETLVAAALEGPFERVLDLGTGSGAILLSLLAERPDASGVGTDLSQAALDVARANAARLGVADRARLILSDWFGAVEGRFDLIVSNPPYIAVDEMPKLAPELHHEPRIALTDEGDGLSAYRALTAGAGPHLRPGGRLLVEIGWQQAAAVTAMFSAAGYEGVGVLPDIDGRDRVISGYLREEVQKSAESRPKKH